MCSEGLREIVFGPDILGYEEYGKTYISINYMEICTLREATKFFCHFQSRMSNLLDFVES